MKAPARIIAALFVIIFLHISHLLSASVVINEIFYNPEFSPEHYYEWVEIYNADVSDVDISSWSFVVGASTYTFKSFNTSDSILTPDSYAVLVTSGTSFLNNHTGYSALLLEFTKTVRLSNAGKYIALLNEFNVIVDSLTYDPDWNNNVEDTSIERSDTAGLSDDPANWHESADIGGTPGKKNSVKIIDELEDSEDQADDIVEPTASLLTAVITEIAPSESSGKDWIEIFILVQTDISSFSLFEQETEIKQFPSLIAEQGTYLILHCDENTTDEIEDTNNNGYLDFYTPDTGLTGTDNVISLRNMSGSIVDAVIFSNKDNESFVPKVSYDACTAAGIWEPQVLSGTIEDYEAGSADWSEGKAGYSLSRVRDFEGFPNTTCPGKSAYWVLNRYPSPGGGFGHTNTSFSTILDVADPNPFSPEDHNMSKRFARINFRVSDGAVKTLYIFDVHGREKIKLIDHDHGFTGESWQGINEGQVSWDGRNKNGEDLSIGIYMLYLEAVNPVTGSKQIGKDTVVIGRKL